MHPFAGYVDAARISAYENTVDATVAMRAVSEMLQKLLSGEQDLLKTAADAGDEGTVALMSELIAGHEKMLWMTLAWLSE